ncbi:MAG TPA: cbb3-type cytochrome oxidase assembly protein CcoS [Bacteroidia bacterium]|nr:cbb3-type cytochrome oxidase assembly protein CcoS [Bacteroidia bacterium]
MEVIYILLSVSILIAIGFLVAFVWSVKKGQYEDVVSPSIRILFEDENNKNKVETNQTTSNNFNTKNKNQSPELKIYSEKL